MNSEAAIIAQVIEHYGAYSAALERRYVQAQQRQPQPEPEPVIPDTPRRHRPVHKSRALISALLRANPRDYSVAEIAEAIGVSRQQVYVACLVLHQRGEVTLTRGKCRNGWVLKYRWRGES